MYQTTAMAVAPDPTPRPAPSPMARELTASDLPALMTVLGESAYCARQLGIQLDLGPRLVRTLWEQTNGDFLKFLCLVLETRLQRTTTPLTLQVLYDAIFEPPLRDEDLAWRLQQSFM